MYIKQNSYCTKNEIYVKHNYTSFITKIMYNECKKYSYKEIFYEKSLFFFFL